MFVMCTTYQSGSPYILGEPKLSKKSVTEAKASGLITQLHLVLSAGYSHTTPVDSTKQVMILVV